MYLMLILNKGEHEHQLGKRLHGNNSALAPLFINLGRDYKGLLHISTSNLRTKHSLTVITDGVPRISKVYCVKNRTLYYSV